MSNDNKMVEMGTNTVDQRQRHTVLESKTLNVNVDEYAIEMCQGRENREGRYFTIVEVNSKLRGSRIVVSMLCCQQFIDGLKETIKTAEGYHKTETNSHQQGNYAKQLANVKSFVSGPRKYYFDLRRIDGILKLRISYVIYNRRDNVTLIIDGIPYLLDILEYFMSSFPPLETQVELTVNQQYYRTPRYFNGARAQFNQRRNYDGRSGVQRGGAVTYADGADGSDGTAKGKEFIRTSGKALEIMKIPKPVEIAVGTKTYVFEFVHGDNDFLRISEKHKIGRRTTLHIPVDGNSYFLETLGGFIKQYEPSDPKEAAPAQ